MRKIVEKKLYSSEYSAWRNAKTRCFNKNNSGYKYYGERGISMDNSWINDFRLFIKDIGPKPSKELTLDRIDNNKGYIPGNCRWATRIEQSNNRRKRVDFSFKNIKKYNVSGLNLSIKEWDNLLGYNSNGVCSFKIRKGITYEEAINFLILKKCLSIKTSDKIPL